MTKKKNICKALLAPGAIPNLRGNRDNVRASIPPALVGVG